MILPVDMDVVITYVDINDKFRQDFSKYVKQDLNEKRFRSYGVLDLQIKMIRKYMSYINNIFVIVSDESQVPGTLDLNSCKIVYHRDIIPEKYLPCFNSCTIEMFMYRIPGLDEEFIYFNDDIFVINYINKEYFFKDGKPCLQFEIKDYSYNETEIYKTNLFNSTKEISKLLRSEKKFDGKYIKMAHSCRPFLKSTCEKVFNKLNFRLISSLTRTRHSKNFNATIFNDYDYMSLNYVNQYPNYTYIESCGLIDKIIDAVNKKETPIICINDNDDYIDFDEFKETLNELFKYNLEKKEYIKKKKEEIITFDNTPLKVALCAIAKNENLYIREWVEWYKKLGVSKIFLYDNNELDGERFEEVINDYIENNFVEIIDRRGIVKTVSTDKDGQTLQGLSFQNCFYTHYEEFDWMCFFDIDEYLEIYDIYDNIYDFLNDFKEYDGIRVQWKMYGDNNQLYFSNDKLYKRFKVESNASYDKHVKQILNCNKIFDEDLYFCAHGVFNKKFNFVNLLKEPVKNVYMDSKAYSDLPVYLNHFYSKSTEEFFKRKYNKPSAVTGINNKRNFNIDFLKNQYFEYNEITEEKEKYIEIFINSNNSVNVYMASLFKDGHVIESIKSIINQPQVKTLTLSANNYTDEEYQLLINSINSSKLIVYRTNNEKLSFEKIRFVTNDISTKYVAFCDDDLIYFDGYFRKMISECELLDAAISYHGGILKQLPIEHYYPDRKTFSFNKEVKENKEVDIIGNGVSLFKRDWISYKEWKKLYKNAPDISMDDIVISYTLRKNGKKLIVIKHKSGEVIERSNKLPDTVYNLYKKNDNIQTEWVNKYFINL